MTTIVVVKRQRVKMQEYTAVLIYHVTVLMVNEPCQTGVVQSNHY